MSSKPAVSSDKLLARDLGRAALPANLFRLRVDAADAVIDLGYLPALLADEMELLKEGSAPLQARISLPLPLAKLLAQELLNAIEQVERAT
jgi:hypothetical protein